MKKLHSSLAALAAAIMALALAHASVIGHRAYYAAEADSAATAGADAPGNRAQPDEEHSAADAPPGGSPALAFEAAREAAGHLRAHLAASRSRDGLASGDNRLSSLSAAEGTLTPAFSPDCMEYHVTVGNDVSRLNLSYTTVDPKAYAVISWGSLTISGVTVQVIAENGATRLYNISVSYQAAPQASDNRLIRLDIAGLMRPGFSPDQLEYSCSDVSYTVGSLELSYETASPTAKVTVTGNNLTAGVNKVTLTVAARNGSTRAYVITVTKQPDPRSSENRLSGLTVAEGTITPAFSPDRMEYAVTVTHDITWLTVQSSKMDQKSSVSTDFRSLAENSTTSLTLTVTAENGQTRTYVIKATRLQSPKSSDSSLSALQVSGFSLSPQFSPQRLEYSVSVPYETARLSVSYRTSGEKATAVVSGSDLTAGAVTSVTVKVTAENGSTRSYVIKATRASAPKSSDNRLISLTAAGYTLSPSFDPDRLEYTLSVPYETAKLSVTYQMSSAKASAAVFGNSLSAGNVTPVTVEVTAENGVSRSYVIRVSRAPAKSEDNRLISLSVEGFTLTPAFSPERLEYSVDVPFNADRLAVSFRTADAKASALVSGNTLSPGEVTTVFVKVTAENGAVRTYLIKASRGASPKSGDNRLSVLSAAGHPLSPLFSPETTEYSVSVENATAKLEITAAAADPKAAVSVTGNALKENAVTPVSVRVTAENGSARVYTISVFRAPAQTDPDDSDSHLGSLVPSSGTLSPSFSGTILSYSVRMPQGVSRVDFAAAPSSPASTVSCTVPEKLERSKENLFTFTVTAGNGSASVYTVSVSLSARRPVPPRPGTGSWVSLPVIDGIGGIDGTMILQAGQLNSLFRSHGSFLTVSNPVGQVIIRGDALTGISLPYYDLTLAYSTGDALPAGLPHDALVVSTAYEGGLFGQVEFRVFADSGKPCRVYLWDPAAGEFMILADNAIPQSGAVSFRSARAGTFVLTSGAIPGAGSTVTADTDAGTMRAATIPVLASLGVLALFCLSYMTGAVMTGQRLRMSRSTRAQARPLSSAGRSLR